MGSNWFSTEKSLVEAVAIRRQRDDDIVLVEILSWFAGRQNANFKTGIFNLSSYCQSAWQNQKSMFPVRANNLVFGGYGYNSKRGTSESRSFKITVNTDAALLPAGKGSLWNFCRESHFSLAAVIYVTRLLLHRSIETKEYDDAVRYCTLHCRTCYGKNHTAESLSEKA